MELPPPSFMGDDAIQVRSRLLAWYTANRREHLPWRGPSRLSLPDSSSSASVDYTGGITPYQTWVSEIMLQQTRVEAVIAHFQRWMLLFPDVKTLAQAAEEDVVAAWAGLGYYSRARNLRKGAQLVMAQFGGVVPSTVVELKKLPGVGDYTAGAIASIAYGVPCPAVDGNVIRVMSRLCALSLDSKSPLLAKHATRLAAQLHLAPTSDSSSSLSSSAASPEPTFYPGDLNQALMELGATLCAPGGAPRCQECPLWGSSSSATGGSRGAPLMCRGYAAAADSLAAAAEASSADACGGGVQDVEDLISGAVVVTASPPSPSSSNNSKRKKQRAADAFGAIAQPAPLASSSAGTTATASSLGEVCRRVAELFPLKSAKKKAPTPMRTALVAVIEIVAAVAPSLPSPGESPSSVALPSAKSVKRRRGVRDEAAAPVSAPAAVSSSSSSQSAASPLYMFFRDVVAASKTTAGAAVGEGDGASSVRSEGEGEEEGAPAASAAASASSSRSAGPAAPAPKGARKGKGLPRDSKLLQGQWAPLHVIVQEGGEGEAADGEKAASPPSAVKKQGKRAAAAAGGGAASSSAAPSASVASLALTAALHQAALQAVMLPELRPAASSSSSSAASPPAEYYSIEVRACAPVQKDLVHVFSHVRHTIVAQHWAATLRIQPALASGPSSSTGAAPASSSSSGGSPGVSATFRSRGSGCGGGDLPLRDDTSSVQAVIVSPAQFPALGLSTWAVKALFGALAPAAVRTTSGSADVSDDDRAGWGWLMKRWTTAGLKLPAAAV